MDKKIQEMMALLNCTEEEAKQVLADDKDIDQGKKKDFDLTPEQQKNAKHRGQRVPKVYNHPKVVNRKENPTKIAIIQALFEFLGTKNYENLKITKKEGEIDFHTDGKDYTLRLIQHRPPKK